jgi:hypothetical protein
VASNGIAQVAGIININLLGEVQTSNYLIDGDERIR